MTGVKSRRHNLGIILRSFIMFFGMFQSEITSVIDWVVFKFKKLACWPTNTFGMAICYWPLPAWDTKEVGLLAITSPQVRPELLVLA